MDSSNSDSYLFANCNDDGCPMDLHCLSLIQHSPGMWCNKLHMWCNKLHVLHVFTVRNYALFFVVLYLTVFIVNSLYKDRISEYVLIQRSDQPQTNTSHVYSTPMPWFMWLWESTHDNQSQLSTPADIVTSDCAQDAYCHHLLLLTVLINYLNMGL